MSTLHLISQPIDCSNFKKNVARFTSDKDQLLFIGDSVTSLLDQQVFNQIQQLSLKSFALAPDCLCRGIDQLVNTEISQISDLEMETQL